MPGKKTLNLGQYRISIPPKWKLNGKQGEIEEQIKKIFEKSDFFEKIPPKTKKTNEGRGISLKRFFTQEKMNPFSTTKWTKRHCKIINPNGSAVFEMKDAEIPADFSQVASDVMISKYFRKAGVPQYDENNRQILNEAGSPKLGSEKSTKQVISRLTGCWRYWGEKYNLFKSPSDAEIFETELQYMLVQQMAAPNSPQWFNTGLAWAYGIKGPAQGHYYVDPDTELLTRSRDAYTRPQPHACFIQSIKDDLVNKGGIMDLWIREARIFKYGSGTGTNFSSIRGKGEPLSGGGTSSGLMSFLKIGDRAAGAIKSGGTTRRAAKMVCLDIDHPEIEKFINWKAKEEKKVKILVEAGYSSDFEGEAYETVSGQNSNNSVRIPNDFMQALKNDRPWALRWRTNTQVSKEVPAKKLWNQIARAAWVSADPGIQYHTTINEWHTCPVPGPIRASNPCSEYMFLDDTACNLASLNLIKFFDQKTKTFDVKAFRHAVQLWIIVLEISVIMAQFPSKSIAQNSFDFRPLGLGYANLGTLLMVWGIPYDSHQARAIAGAIAAIMTGQAYATSAQLAFSLGAFPQYKKNREAMLRVIRNHRRATFGIGLDDDTQKDSSSATQLGNYENLQIKPQALNPRHCPQYLLTAAQKIWDEALEQGKQWGFRNAQVSVIAPTGTTGLLMDCDTTGVEPDFALVKFKKLAGGGYWKIPNQSIKPALENLGYTNKQIEEILRYIIGYNSLNNPSPINTESLLNKGLTVGDLQKIAAELPKVFELRYAFTKYTLGEESLKRLGISKSKLKNPDFSLLEELEYSEVEQEEANKIICGHMTIEGAPGLQNEHLPVFDCANRCGNGQRFIDPMGHVKMLSAVQPFISGSISKTINLPRETTVEEIEKIYLESWKLGLKAVALYRDGCKLSQPLSTISNVDKTDSKNSVQPENQTISPLLHRSSSTKQLPPSTQPPSAQKQTSLPMQLSFIERGTKKELPQRRQGITIETNVAGHKIFLRTGEYEDGSLGEIFIDMHKEGAAFRSLLNCFAIAVSLGIQYGVPLKKLVDKFTFTRFEPNGPTNHPNIKTATSIIDFIFRVLGMEYLNRTDFIHILPEQPDKINNFSNSTTTKENQLDKKEQINQKKSLNLQYPLKDNSSDLTNSAVSDFYSTLMGDAPACSECGHITVRNGNCYRCLNCGASLGCS